MSCAELFMHQQKKDQNKWFCLVGLLACVAYNVLTTTVDVLAAAAVAVAAYNIAGHSEMGFSTLKWQQF